MFRFIIFTASLVLTSALVNLGCKSDPLPEGPNQGCPDNYTRITAGGCCPDKDVFIIDNSTTTSPTPKTTSAPCIDKINPSTGTSDCPKRKYLCTDPNYKKVMKEQCPKTCGFCNSGTTLTPSTCSDKINPATGTSDCPKKKYLCTDPTYKGLMKEQCPKTCGYC